MLNVAIVGAGAIVKSHIEGFLTLGNRVKIVAIADSGSGRAQEIISKYSLSAKAYNDYKDMLSDVELDIAVVCTPPATHCRVTVDCLNAGAHVLLEKPMAHTLAECDEILNAARTNNKQVSIVAQSRFMTASRNVKRILESNICGKLLYSQAYSAWWRGGSYYDLDWRGKWDTEGGGCTMSQAIHHIDMLLWLSGMPTEVTAIMGNLNHTNSEVEDISMSLLRFGDGSFGQITCSLLHHGEQQKMIFQTERAGISLPFAVSASKSMPNGFPQDNPQYAEEIEALAKSYEPLRHEGHTGQIHDFVNAIERGGLPLVTGEMGRNAIEVIMAIYKSSVSKIPIKLPISKDDPFYTKTGIASAPKFYEKTKSVRRAADGEITIASERF